MDPNFENVVAPLVWKTRQPVVEESDGEAWISEAVVRERTGCAWRLHRRLFETCALRGEECTSIHTYTYYTVRPSRLQRRPYDREVLPGPIYRSRQSVTGAGRYATDQVPPSLPASLRPGVSAAAAAAGPRWRRGARGPG